MCLVAAHGFSCFMFDVVVVAMMFLLFCHPGPARVCCLLALRLHNESVTLLGAVGTCVHVGAFVAFVYLFVS